MNYIEVQEYIEKLSHKNLKFKTDNCFTVSVDICGKAYNKVFKLWRPYSFKKMRRVLKKTRSYEEYLKSYFKKHGLQISEKEVPNPFCPVYAEVQGKKILCNFVLSGYLVVTQTGVSILKRVKIIRHWEV